MYSSCHPSGLFDICFGWPVDPRSDLRCCLFGFFEVYNSAMAIFRDAGRWLDAHRVCCIDFKVCSLGQSKIIPERFRPLGYSALFGRRGVLSFLQDMERDVVEALF